MNEKLPLNSLHLKLLAVVTMLIDHMGFTLFPHAVWMRAVGRLAFPIFCFLIAEGCAHTHDKKRYAGRLLLFAVLSELPFNLMCSGQWLSWNHQNVLWTLLIGALVCWAMDWARTRPEMWQRLPADAAIAVGFLLGQVCNTDYGGWGVMTVALFYLCREGRYARCGLLLGMLVLNGLCISSRTVPAFGIAVPIQILAAAALPVIWLYNGRPGVNRHWRWAFYAFYPTHLLVLEGIQALT